MLLMLETYIRGGVCHSVYQYTKANNKYMKYNDKNKISLYLQYWDIKHYIVRQCRKRFQKIILNGSKTLLNLMNIS